MMSRGRSYVKTSPMSLSVKDINSYLEAHPTALSRDEFDDAIYAIDARWFELKPK